MDKIYLFIMKGLPKQITKIPQLLKQNKYQEWLLKIIATINWWINIKTKLLVKIIRGIKFFKLIKN